MNHINVSISVEKPVSETLVRLTDFLREFAPLAEMPLVLRAPFDISALHVGLTLERSVVARFAPLGQSSEAYAVAWQPAAGGPFPAFSGTIYVTADESRNESIVTLDGHYHPPLGVAGDVFDVIIGRHIAQASVTDLLQRITQYIDGVTAQEPAFA